MSDLEYLKRLLRQLTMSLILAVGFGLVGGCSVVMWSGLDAAGVAIVACAYAVTGLAVGWVAFRPKKKQSQDKNRALGHKQRDGPDGRGASE